MVLPWRLERVGERKGVLLLDCSRAKHSCSSLWAPIDGIKETIIVEEMMGFMVATWRG